MDLQADTRNFCRLVLLLLKVGKPKLRQFFINKWKAVKGHKRWTDCEKNGEDLLRLFTNPLAHELDAIKSGNTLEWSLSLVIKVLLHLEKPLFIRRGKIKALKYLGELREEVGRKLETEIGEAEFEIKWNDACNALSLFGARSSDFMETKRDMKQNWGQLYPLLRNVASHEKDILEILPTLHRCVVRCQSAEYTPLKVVRYQSAGYTPLKDEGVKYIIGRITPINLAAKPCSLHASSSSEEDIDIGEQSFVAESGSSHMPLHMPQSYSEGITVRPLKVPLPYKKNKNEYIFHVSDYDDLCGQSFDVSETGIFLELPPKRPFIPFTLKCIVPFEIAKSIPSPVGKNETLVSYIVKLESPTYTLKRIQQVIVTLVHSGADKTLGYENVMKVFDEDKMLWREERMRLLRTKQYKGTNSIQVLVNIPTILAVVTRLITDRFQVTPKGCVVRSSVCDDVTIEFPQGAVDKTVEGTMKLMLMPENIHDSKDACPILCTDGFSSTAFLKSVIVKMPLPNNTAEYSTKDIQLLRLDDYTWEYKEWKDVTDQVKIVKFKTHTEFHVNHFSCLWPWMSKTRIRFASTIFRYLRSPPRAVCFAAFKDTNEDASLSPKLTLVCVANHEQYETVSKMKGEGYFRLALATADRKMRPDDKAYLKVNGADMRIEFFFLRFLKDEVCRKELRLLDQAENHEELVLNFFPNPEEPFDVLLVSLQISKNLVFLRRGIERQRTPLAHQQEVEEQAQPLEGAVANLPSVSSEEEEEGIRDLVSRFSKASLATLGAAEVAEGLRQYLGLDRTLIADPPYEIIQKCQQFCRFLKDNRRKDIVEALRDELPSGMTGPLMDGKTFVKNLDHGTKLTLSRALSVTDQWQTFAEKIGITYTDIRFYSERVTNPVLKILDDNCAYMNIDTLYRLLVESEANAIADIL
ncbi:uncharacterized protein LOC116293177 [Actinia tenebrosa]|uniref:Uncharacterized protein LOC116293177 n=1 Tax=Actinia tenebrosa TaxID=6105 RepID=A0A6P8HUT4_ACTTE|nr:uncharacterized protein LOC116293177 [Actinia tenebrosa]